MPKTDPAAPSDVLRSYHVTRLADAIDTVLTVLEDAERAGVELDPLTTIIERYRVRGGEVDFSELPPLMQMLLSGLLPE